YSLIFSERSISIMRLIWSRHPCSSGKVWRILFKKSALGWLSLFEVTPKPDQFLKYNWHFLFMCKKYGSITLALEFFTCAGVKCFVIASYSVAILFSAYLSLCTCNGLYLLPN